MEDDHTRAIAEAAEVYRRASAAKDAASQRLAGAMRAAYAAGTGQSMILRAAGHVWSREYLRVLLGLAKGRGRIRC